MPAPIPYQAATTASALSCDVGHGQDWRREKVEGAIVKMSPIQTETQMA